MELYPYQKTGGGFLQGRQAALLFDEMGLGKTVQANQGSRLGWTYPGGMSSLSKVQLGERAETVGLPTPCDSNQEKERLP